MRSPSDRGRSQRIISLLTDFGSSSAYVGMMKGVILSIHPRAQIVDLSHGVRAHDVRQAAFLLQGSVGSFPAETVHLVVVDPGVGTERRALAAYSAGQYFVGPDNGVLSWMLLEPCRAVWVEREDLYRSPVSQTFHGRDVFAPVAAHLSLGTDLEDLGPPALEIVRLRPPRTEVTPDSIRGEVMDVDGFGNLITSITGDQIPREVPLRIRVGALETEDFRATYGEGRPGAVIAYVGSTGYVEIAAVGRRATDRVAEAVGMDVEIRIG